jgi:biotin carboxylase
MQLAEAAGVCDLVWLVDGALPEMMEMASLLRRFGPVIDRQGLVPDQLAPLVAAYHPDGLVTYLDAGMVDYAVVAARLGLPFHSPATAAALTDKAEQRRRLAEAGLAMPRCRVVPPGPGAAALEALAGGGGVAGARGVASAAGPGGGEEQAWPAIIKPRSAQGSRYTFLAADPADAARLLDALGPGRPEMVIEDFLPDDPGRAAGPYAGYVSVESIVARGVISHLALTGRFPLAENFRETGFFIPAALAPEEQKEVLTLADAAIEALGVQVGCLHTEIKFTPDGLRVIEVNGRIGGGVPEMLQRAAGVGLVEMTLRVALDEPTRVDGPVATERIGYRFFLQPPAVTATVAAIDGLDRFREHSGADTISVHQGPGAGLDWRDGSRNHIVAVVGSAADYPELLAAERLLNREITVTYADVRT